MPRAILTCAILWWMGACGIAHAAPSLEAYGKLPAIEDMVLSPDGKSFAFIALEGEKGGVRSEEATASVMSSGWAARFRA